MILWICLYRKVILTNLKIIEVLLNNEYIEWLVGEVKEFRLFRKYCGVGIKA